MSRISQLTIGTASERQTANNEFGAMLARGLTASTGTMLGVASAIVPTGGVVTAAITQTTGAASSGAGASVRAMSGVGGGLGGGTGIAKVSGVGGGTASSGAEGLEGQRELMLQNQQWTAQYLSLQNEMQRESREFTAISNILKVRHESAKTAINNIR